MPNSTSFQNEFRTRISVDLKRHDFFLIKSALYHYYRSLSKGSELLSADRSYDLVRIYELFELFNELRHVI